MYVDRRLVYALSLLTLSWTSQPTQAAPCAAHQGQKIPQDFTACTAQLIENASNPSRFIDSGSGTFKLSDYENQLNKYLENYCYRDTSGGKWYRDKWLRDTGPWVSILDDGAWSETPAQYGTHYPVVIWYNETTYRWLENDREGPLGPGAMMIKEMYDAPAARCNNEERRAVDQLEPNGIALMIQAPEIAHDGWFWGFWAPDQSPDWPAGEQNPLPVMGFGQYCLNCHASADAYQTFADIKNIHGQPGRPNVYLSQNFLFENSLVDEAPAGRHHATSYTTNDVAFHESPLPAYSESFLKTYSLKDTPPTDLPTENTVVKMPSQTYDNVWVAGSNETPPAAAGVTSEFLTSDQCIGCHDAGSTGLQFDMTMPDSEHSGRLLNYSPFGTWQTSPMGLAGRDPIFFAQLASEGTFHPEKHEFIQDICLGCHGIGGQRQFVIDSKLENPEQQSPPPFLRAYVNAVPYLPNGEPNLLLDKAPYGALARDGISCTSCHHMVLTEQDTKANKNEPWNYGVSQRQSALGLDSGVDFMDFAKTFTGSFFVGPPDVLSGPFSEPQTKPMENTLGITPQHSPSIQNSGICGSCHTVYLPILYEGEIVGHTYEQTTYAEWAFSDYRLDDLPWGNEGVKDGEDPKSCQHCHMRSKGLGPHDPPFRSKIASIQEYSNFPQSDNILEPDEIDLQVREGFARHTLVGLNLFFVEMAKQLPAFLGIRTQDPMMVDNGLDPILLTERAVLEQAESETAEIEVSDTEKNGNALTATVTITSHVGHKFPTGVGFRRAFIEFSVLDTGGKILWASGGTDENGVILDEKGEAIAGERFWETDCSKRIQNLDHQPHYQTIDKQSQAQIYQELVVAPPEGLATKPVCGKDYPPGGLFTTSFLSICGHVKDNRILPKGFLDQKWRNMIAKKLGVHDANHKLANEAGTLVKDDPDYYIPGQPTGGGDSLVYNVELPAGAQPTHVKATLYYQATPPYYLQDRFCTSKSKDTDRLYYMAGHLDLNGSRAEDWKLEVVSTGKVKIP